MNLLLLSPLYMMVSLEELSGFNVRFFLNLGNQRVLWVISFSNSRWLFMGNHHYFKMSGNYYRQRIFTCNNRWIMIKQLDIKTLITILNINDLKREFFNNLDFKTFRKRQRKFKMILIRCLINSWLRKLNSRRGKRRMLLSHLCTLLWCIKLMEDINIRNRLYFGLRRGKQNLRMRIGRITPRF